MPGRTARHAKGAFDGLCDTARPGMDARALAECDAWLAGWQYLRDGYYWEAHELFEPVWMQTAANSRERHLVQAAIQTANAALKEKMQRPRAVLRLCDLAQAHLAACGPKGAALMGVSPGALDGLLRDLRARANLSAGES